MPIRTSQVGSSGAPTVVAGNHTPADAYANPTDALDAFSLGAVFNGTTWDRVREATADNMAATGIPASGGMIFDGTTWDRWRGDSTGGGYVQGPAASGATQAGNPVKAGGVFNTTPPTVTTGQAVDWQMSNRGEGKVAISFNDTVVSLIAQPSSDGVSASANRGLGTLGLEYLFNGTTWDRRRGTNTGAWLAAGQTATQSNVALTNYNAAELLVVINISAFTSGTLTVAVSGTTSSSYSIPLLTSAALGAAATTVLQIGPGLPTTANLSANMPLPRNLLLTATVSGGGSLTYGIDYVLCSPN